MAVLLRHNHINKKANQIFKIIMLNTIDVTDQYARDYLIRT
jgi:hypothetical protein